MITARLRHPLLAAALAIAAAAAAPAANPPEFAEWPAATSPAEIGGRVAENWAARELQYRTSPRRRYVIYPEVCAWYGALTTAELAGNTALRQRLIEKFDPLLGEDAWRISPQAHVDYRVFGTLPLELFRQTRDPRYLELGRTLADWQWTDPTPDGVTREARYWIDDMYMITVLQVQAHRVTGDPRYLDRAAVSMVAYLDRLQEPNGLFYHAPDTPFFWGRGNGWMAAGLAELLRDLPAEHPQRERILAGGRRMLETLLQHQGEDGLWRQLVDRPESWPETSSTGMFAFAMVSGVKDGWLERARYAPAARRAWLALAAQLDADANVREVCVGTNKAAREVGPDLDTQYKFYLERPRRTGDLHGQAPILWTASALLR